MSNDTNSITSTVAGRTVNDSLVAEAATGDDLAISVLTGIVSTIAFYAGKDDDALMAWDADHSRWARMMCAEGDYDEAENHYYEQAVIGMVMEAREEIAANARATARYMSDRAQGLTHNPFMALLEAHGMVA